MYPGFPPVQLFPLLPPDDLLRILRNEPASARNRLEDPGRLHLAVSLLDRIRIHSEFNRERSHRRNLVQRPEYAREDISLSLPDQLFIYRRSV